MTTLYIDREDNTITPSCTRCDSALTKLIDDSYICAKCNYEYTANIHKNNIKTKKAIEDRIKELKSDVIYSYPPADVVINAPLALMQVELKARIIELEWVLNKETK